MIDTTYISPHTIQDIKSLSSTMEHKDWINLYALILSPIIAIVITLWHQSRKEKREQRMELFLNLIKSRQTFPPTQEFVNALNTIDVIFHNDKNVISTWKDFFSFLFVLPINVEIYNRKLLDLLFAMSNSLGYDKIKQTDLSAFYTPIVFNEQKEFQKTLNEELLRVLKNSQSFGTPKPPKL